MEKRLNKKIDDYISEFKNDIRSKVTELVGEKDETMNKLLIYIYDYAHPCLSKQDFQKRKRVKNYVPVFDRCCAKRASTEQCTRRKKEGSDYCGTHIKGVPHGVMVQDEETNKVLTQKVEVWAEDIQGIVYYIDKCNNVYKAEDIVSNKLNPKIIAKYVKVGEKYTIPEFNI